MTTTGRTAAKVTGARPSRRRAVLRIARRLAVASLVLGLLVAVSVLGLRWRFLERLGRESALVATPRGPIEVARVGGGPPVLFLHGAPGGYDQLLPLARAVSRQGFEGLAVSRPGYLRTPLSVGRTPAAQADALADLLGTLELPAVTVVAVSAGGPTALQLALRHPDRVRALVFLAAVAERFREGEPDPEEVRDFDLAWDLGALAGATLPSVGLRLLGVTDPESRAALRADPAVREAVSALFGSLGFHERRRDGYRADMLEIEWDDLDLPLRSIRAPTLVLHGSEDQNVPLAHGEKIAAGVPGARLEVLEGGAHAFFVLDRAWLEGRLFAFLDEVHR